MNRTKKFLETFRFRHDLPTPPLWKNSKRKQIFLGDGFPKLRFRLWMPKIQVQYSTIHLPFFLGTFSAFLLQFLVSLLIFLYYYFLVLSQYVSSNFHVVSWSVPHTFMVHSPYFPVCILPFLFQYIIRTFQVKCWFIPRTLLLLYQFF